MKIMLLHAAAPLARELSRRGHEVLSCNTIQRPTVSMAENDSLFRSFSIAGRRKIHLGSIRELAEQVRRFRPDVVHAFSPASLAWSIFATLGLRSGPRVFSYRGITRSLRRLDPSEWISYLSPRVAMHACESGAVMDAMVRSGVPAAKCHVVYNVHWDFELAKTPEAWRSEWGMGSNDWIIGTVANVRPVKGIDILLRALLRMTDLPGWRLVVIGNVEHDEVVRLSNLPELRERVLLRGPCDSAPSAMRAFDVFAMPSRSEGLCRALIEAMTLGICPVVSAAGGMKELVRDRQDGWVCPVEDEESLHCALRKLYQDRGLQRDFASSAKEHVQTLCSPRVVVNKLEAMYLAG